MLKNKKKIIKATKVALVMMAIYKIVDFRFQKNLFTNERPYNQMVFDDSDMVETHDQKTLTEIINF